MSDTTTQDGPVPFKEYHLIPQGDRVKMLKKYDGKMIPFETFDDYPLPTRFRFTDENGTSKVLRYLGDTDELDQAKQIKDGFLANLPHTKRDRRTLTFRGGILRTNKRSVQKFLDSIPPNESFKGDRGSFPVIFKEYKPEAARKTSVEFGYRQAKAVMRIHEAEEAEMDIMLLKIFSSVYALPTGEDSKAQKIIVLQDAVNENEAALDIILEENNQTIADTVETIIGKAINAEVLSFIQKPDQVSIKRDGKWNDLFKISAEHTDDQKQSLFRDYVQSADGKAMLDAIKEGLKKANVPVTEEKAKKDKTVKT